MSVLDCRWHRLRISPKTTWCFVEIVDAAGLSGVGEATLAGQEDAVQRAVDALRSQVGAWARGDYTVAAARAAAHSLADYTAVSALDQAMRDLDARRRGIALAEALGDIVRRAIPVYANINRGTLDRTPHGFAVRARQAVADGFDAIKIAPFDGVDLYGDDSRSATDAGVDAGIERIAAVREAIGADVALMVDCHWRLNRDAARNVLAAVDPLHLHWLECPIPETPQAMPQLRALRADANRRGVRLAGCETMCGLAGFAPFIEAGAYDAMMPDAKYVGGLDEMLAVANALAAAGLAFSPHNPSGPVCHAVSVQVCGVAPALDRLELQYAETPVFDALVSGRAPRAAAGVIVLPEGPGSGIALDRAITRERSA